MSTKRITLVFVVDEKNEPVDAFFGDVVESALFDAEVLHPGERVESVKVEGVSCGMRKGCVWRADLFNGDQPDAHYQVTCYSEDGPAEVCVINPDILLDEARQIAEFIAKAQRDSRGIEVTS